MDLRGCSCVAKPWEVPSHSKGNSFYPPSSSIPAKITIYFTSTDGILELEGFTSVYKNVHTKSSLLNHEDLMGMHGNTKAAIDYYALINCDAYIATYFGNMDKIVAAMRASRGLFKTLFLSRKAFVDYNKKGLKGEELMKALWRAHHDDFIMGREGLLCLTVFAITRCSCYY